MGKCQMVWAPGWTNVELSNSLYRTSSLAVPLKENIREPLYDCMRGIHQLVLKQSGHLQLAGHLPSTDPTTGQSSADPSSLTSFQLLMERVVGIERELGGHNSNTGFAGEFSTPYIGPLTFRSLLENFCGIYSVKKLSQEESGAAEEGPPVAGEDRERGGEDERISSNQQKEHTTVCQQCSQLLEKLTGKSCQVERVRALLSGSGSVMSAIQLTAEEEKAMAEDCEDEDEFLANLLGSCLRKKGSRLELQLAMARERERDAQREEEEARKAMIAARDEVQYCEERINRNTVDQIKSLPSPPAVVCTVMQSHADPPQPAQRKRRGRRRGRGERRGFRGTRRRQSSIQCLLKCLRQP
ncbi:hypothetical protein GBAR_LOCUS9310 [Geodia barretti]|uniref:Uncharacterized protein n=1 Tax=Geodia barretti TaxID=519541 RepID=A0AA35WB73_GEOBA|nr:hypothetical protein GBAR_LOCUS9310 [Geodia barretti]